MQLAMVGLGRMGANMVRRLIAGGHDCLAYDVSPEAVKALEAVGATGASSLADLVPKMTAPRAVWIMVPAAITGRMVDELADLLEPGDAIIDGGNSYYRDDIDRAEALRAKNLHYIDVGTSGGVWGLERGYCLMIGGDPDAVGRLEPIWRTLAPGTGTAERTRGRSGDPSPSEEGWLHCGPNGAGHFVKMVHNGIEYALMTAYAEGLNILKGANAGNVETEADAETAPLRDPKYYKYELDLAEVTEVWRRGSVVASWLLDLTAAALKDDPSLEQFGGRVSDSGEGRWTSTAAIDEGIPAPLLTTALYGRFGSRGSALFADKIQSAQRKEFGGHHEKPV
jgi:6-phosphogluconate dehydrogenase